MTIMKIVMLLICVATINLNINSANATPITKSNEQLSRDFDSIIIESKYLREKREVWVYLPKGYAESTKDYPVIFLLDGKRHFEHAIVSQSILQTEEMMPGTIIVAVTNKSGNRRRDLVTNRVAFVNYLNEEVVSAVKKYYRTSSQLTLFGHSLAGAFATDVLLNQNTAFTNFIAASPVLQIESMQLISRLETYKPTIKASLYLSMGDELAEGVSASTAFEQFLTILKEQQTHALNWHATHLAEQVHMTTPALTLYAGLTHLFSDYQLPRYMDLSDFNHRGGMESLTNLFKKRGEKYQISPNIPEVALRRLGFTLFDTGSQKEGLEILLLNMEKYPDSARAINALAQVYEDMKQPERAISTYKKGLKITEKGSRTHEHFVNQLKRLKTLGES